MKPTDRSVNVIWQVLLTYWRLFGGLNALLYSPFVWVSLVLNLLVFPLWCNEVENAAYRYLWIQVTWSIIPTILGLSTASFTILLSLLASHIAKIFTGNGDAKSSFIKVAASFFHVFISQILTLFLALFTMAFPNFLTSLLGSFILLYSLSLLFALALELFNLAYLANLASGHSVDDIEASFK